MEVNFVLVTTSQCPHICWKCHAWRTMGGQHKLCVSLVGLNVNMSVNINRNLAFYKPPKLIINIFTGRKAMEINEMEIGLAGWTSKWNGSWIATWRICKMSGWCQIPKIRMWKVQCRWTENCAEASWINWVSNSLLLKIKTDRFHYDNENTNTQTPLGEYRLNWDDRFIQ